MTAKVLEHPHCNRIAPRRIAIAHRERLVRAALRALFEADPGVSVVGEAADSEAAVALARAARPDALVLDTDLPGLGATVARRLGAETAVVVVDGDEDPAELFDALDLRAPTPKENPMFTPNVIELRRGSAHGAACPRRGTRRPRATELRLVKPALAGAQR